MIMRRNKSIYSISVKLVDYKSINNIWYYNCLCHTNIASAFIQLQELCSVMVLITF